ncbi:MAG: acyl-CoA desaturase [Thermoleophilaceae bacterium]|nr:acyl-CoA desaturase [Thermoleophilaceae bacterium]
MHSSLQSAQDAPVQPANPAPSEVRRRLPEDVQPTNNETLDRALTGFATFAPMLLLLVAAWQVWNRALFWNDVLIFFFMYTITALGVTVGFHRLFTHRSFKTKRPIKIGLAICGSMAVEGPVISWVADHRKHHAFSDVEGDPHSPHVGRPSGWRGAFHGLLHAHVGWIFMHDERGSHERFAADLLADKDIVFVQRRFLLWVLLGLAIPFAMGLALTGTLTGGLTGLLWGGAVRMFVLHHVTFSINSLCHFFGKPRYETGDRSTNLYWLAIPSFGEAWHNNHHAFPTSSRHGIDRFQIDLSAIFIDTLEKLGLAWDVVRVSPERKQDKALRP